MRNTVQFRLLFTGKETHFRNHYMVTTLLIYQEKKRFIPFSHKKDFFPSHLQRKYKKCLQFRIKQIICCEETWRVKNGQILCGKNYRKIKTIQHFFSYRVWVGYVSSRQLGHVGAKLKHYYTSNKMPKHK